VPMHYTTIALGGLISGKEARRQGKGHGEQFFAKDPKRPFAGMSHVDSGRRVGT
jgi:hypothetical protein